MGRYKIAFASSNPSIPKMLWSEFNDLLEAKLTLINLYHELPGFDEDPHYDLSKAGFGEECMITIRPAIDNSNSLSKNKDGLILHQIVIESYNEELADHIAHEICETLINRIKDNNRGKRLP